MFHANHIHKADAAISMKIHQIIFTINLLRRILCRQTLYGSNSIGVFLNTQPRSEEEKNQKKYKS
jgi:hypothetical protein